MIENRPSIVVLACALAACVAVAGALALLPSEGEPARAVEATRPRVISLMPPISETLFEIGAGSLLVGRSDYCMSPPELSTLPPCGTALTPNAEAIARLSPTLILANSSEATARGELRTLGRAEFLPWLDTEEMIASTRRLGELTGHEPEAHRLADELARVLLVPEPASGPRVLLVMSLQAGKIDPVSFLRKNSVHGHMLHAAGGRNAVSEEIHGVPELSLERVIELDPELIVLVGNRELDAETRARDVAAWLRITPLSAAKNRRVGLVGGAHFYGAGSQLLRAVTELRAEIERLSP